MTEEELAVQLEALQQRIKAIHDSVVELEPVEGPVPNEIDTRSDHIADVLSMVHADVRCLCRDAPLRFLGVRGALQKKGFRLP